jgi:hypothetical protein
MEKVSLSEVLTAVDRHKLFLLRVTNNDLGRSLSSFQERGIPVVNVGLILAKYLKELPDMEYLHLETYEYLRKVLDSEKRRVSSRGNEVLLIYNLGILLESPLQINAIQLFKDFSKTSALLIAWEYRVSTDGILTWPSQPDQFHFNFSELQLKYIEDAL